MTIADRFLVTAFTPRVHVRHLAVDGWAPGPQIQLSVNAPVHFPLCGKGASDSRYRFADERDGSLPLCIPCRLRLGDYIEAVQREGEVLL